MYWLAFFLPGHTAQAGAARRRAAGSRHSASAVGGFTLLEVMTVVAVIAILSGIAVYSINTNLDRIKADTAARRVSIALNYARIRAIAEDCNYLVTFKTRGALANPSQSKCYIEMVADVNKNGVKDADEKFRTEDLPKGIVYNLGTKEDIYDVAGDTQKTDGIAFTGNSVTFKPRGDASSKGEVYVIPEASLEKGYNDNRRAISLEKLSGRTIVWFYRSALATAGKNPWVEEGK